MDRRAFCRSAGVVLAGSVARLDAWGVDGSSDQVVVRPKEYAGALKNPLKGLRSSDPASAKKLPYASLAKSYIKWNQIEGTAADGVGRIREFCDAEWAGLAAINTKVIPRVYLEWPPDGHYWPADLPRGEYESDAFKKRVVALIEKLGDAWDNDPRVAFVETGIVGLWGEQHDPAPSAALQKVIGDAYTASFRNKLLMNRYPGLFVDYKFGIYWDSFGHKEEMVTHMPLLTSARMAERWKIAPMGGETAFDWGTPLGKNPTDALVHNADSIIELIHKLHWNHLGWLSNYDQSNAVAVANAARVQEGLGYRFVLDEVRYPQRIVPGETFRVSVAMRNTGSSPLYANWPLDVSLLDPHTREVRWKQSFAGVDLRTVLPEGGGRFEGASACPRDLPKGEYILALAILDPAGQKPAVRFACEQYFNGGRHPIGWVGVGMKASAKALPRFDDPARDHSLAYTG